MKVSKRGSTSAVATRSRYHRRKTLVLFGLGSVVFVLYNYVSLIGKLSMYSESVYDPYVRLSEKKSTTIWKSLPRNKTRLGIHVLRPKTPIRSIIILGERHSGTTFFTKYLQDCFPKINVGDTFVNNKHWMQHDPEYLLRSVYDESTPFLWKEIVQHSDILSEPISNSYFQNSLVLVLIRNPYDWVEAMRLKPWHWPNHLSLFPLSAEKEPLNIKAHKQNNGASNGGHSVEKSFVGHTLLDWKDFVNRPLYLEEEYTEEEPKLCQMGYAPKTVSPCRNNPNYVPKPLRSIPKAFLRHLPFDTNNPVYEHNPSDGKPFSNLLELRAAKLRNVLSLPEKWELAGIGFVPYDNLLGKGLQSLANEIGSILGVSDSCPSLEPFEKAPYNFSDEYKNWITDAVQWDVENLIGYYPRAS